MPDHMEPGPRRLSPAQLPIWYAEMLHRNTSRWTQVTVATLHGPIDPDRMEEAIRAAVAYYPALRTRISLEVREPRQVFTAAEGVPVERHDLTVARELTVAQGVKQQVLVANFIIAAASHRFRLYDSALFWADILVLGPEDTVLVFRLHHMAADGIALALVMKRIAACYRGELDGLEVETSRTYEQWLDRQDQEVPALEAALAFYGEEIAGATVRYDTLYDGLEAAQECHEPPDLPESTCTLDAEAGGRLKQLAATNRATPFIVLFAAYATMLAAVVGSPDLVINTFVSGRSGEAEDLVGMCINTMLVRLRLGDHATAAELIGTVREAWRPVRRFQSVPLLSLCQASGGTVPSTAQFAINYLDMAQASFDLPGVVSQVTHAQQGFPLNDVLFYVLREQDGRLRMRLISGTGTPRLSRTRLDAMLAEIVRILQSWFPTA